MKKMKKSAMAGALTAAMRATLCVTCLATSAVACTSDDPDPSVAVAVLPPPPMEDPVTVTFGFGYDYDVRPMTRAASPVGTVATHLDLWVCQGDDINEVHQTSATEGFGTVNMTLDRSKTYTLYAVAHKADGAATLTDGIISFPDDKVKDTFWYSTTFSPADATTVACELERIVAAFRLSITDGIPAEVKRLRITMAGVYDRWSVTDGAAHQTDRVVTVNYGGTSANFLVYAIVPEAETLHTVTVEALDDGDRVVQQRTFPDVPLRRNFKTQFTGDFFTSQPMAITLTAASDWQEYEPVSF